MIRVSHTDSLMTGQKGRANDFEKLIGYSTSNSFFHMWWRHLILQVLIKDYQIMNINWTVNFMQGDTIYLPNNEILLKSIRRRRNKFNRNRGPPFEGLN